MGIVMAFFVWKFKNPDVMALPERFQFGAGSGWASRLRADRLAAVSGGGGRGEACV